ncbi:MAG: hypothetical protein JWN94_3849 [Betaproteobacteria bacterium]|nr:hypothetical protein [Betaproteobacteria bacterium]
MHRLAWLLPLLFAGIVAAADDRAEIQNLYAAMNALNLEQQALFQQFQMLQEMRRSNDRAYYTNLLPTPRQDMEVPNYADLIQYQREVARRAEDLSRQSDQLYSNFSELSARKARLMQRIFALTGTQ